MWPKSRDMGRLSFEASMARSLLRFCEEHGYSDAGLADLRTCTKALTVGDRDAALAAFRQIPLGGMGTFGDWLPGRVFEHETDEYAKCIFDALLARWSYLMRALE
jgi:hypothetical protein